MIRPVMMNSNFTFGFNRNRKDIKTETKTQKPQPPKPPVDSDFSAFSSETEEKRVHSAFIIGALFGALAGGAGITAYDNYETNNMMHDMMEEVGFGTNAFLIKDVNKDSTPEIILEGTDGFNTVYDLKSNKVYIDTGDELVEKE